MVVIKGLLSVEMLYGAWIRVKKNRAAGGVDGEDAARFEEDIEANLEKIIRDVVSGGYKPFPARLVEIPKENGGVRPITIFCIRDKILQTAVNYYLEFAFKKIFSDVCFGFRRSRGVLDAVAYIVSRINSDTRIFVKADIENFFGSIDRELLIEILERNNIHPYALWLIDLWINSPCARGTKLYKCAKGIPQGLPLSPTLSNIYLTGFDRFAQTAGIEIARYSDDMLFLADNEVDALHKLNKLHGYLIKKRRLRFNPEKIFIVDSDDGVEFLGKKIRTKNSRFKGVIHN